MDQEQDSIEEKREQEEKRKQEEKKYILYQIQQRINRRNSVSDISAVIAASDLILDGIRETGRSVITILEDQFSDEPEEDSAWQMNMLEEELTSLKKADQRMAEEYETLLGPEEMLLVECAECVGLPDARVKERMKQEQAQEFPNEKKLALYQSILDCGGIESKKEQLLGQLKTQRENIIKEFFGETGGGVSRLDEAASRVIREKAIEEMLQTKKFQTKKPFTLDELVKSEFPDSALLDKKAPAAIKNDLKQGTVPAKTMGRELIPKKS